MPSPTSAPFEGRLAERDATLARLETDLGAHVALAAALAAERDESAMAIAATRAECEAAVARLAAANDEGTQLRAELAVHADRGATAAADAATAHATRAEVERALGEAVAAGRRRRWSWPVCVNGSPPARRRPPRSRPRAAGQSVGPDPHRALHGAGRRLSQSEQRCDALERALVDAGARGRRRSAEQRAGEAVAEREQASAAALEQLRQALAGREAALAEALSARETEQARREAAGAAHDVMSARLFEVERAHAAAETQAAEAIARADENAARIAVLETSLGEARAADLASNTLAAELADEVARLRDELGRERSEASAVLDEALAEVGTLRLRLSDAASDLEVARAALAANEGVAAERDELSRRLAASARTPRPWQPPRVRTGQTPSPLDARGSPLRTRRL